MTENLERAALAQRRNNHDWVNMINNYWGRKVAWVEPVMGKDKDGNHAMVGTVIASSQPWPSGYPQHKGEKS